MATTTNYSWSTPDDTALVKDGAAAIRSLGTAIDTTVFTNAGAAINKTIIDAAGDLIYGTAADTAARLAIGTANQQLRVNSGATAPEWFTPAGAGGMTLLSTTTLSGATTTVSSIDQTYTDLVIVVKNAVFGTGEDSVFIRPNGTTNIVTGTCIRNIAGTAATLAITNSAFSLHKDYANTGGNNVNTITIHQYASSSAYKSAECGGFTNSSGGETGSFFAGAIKTNTAITSFTVVVSNGYTFSGGTVLVYGVK